MSQSTVTQLRPNIDNWEARCDLAAAFRWTARLNMHEAVANHLSLAVSEDGKQFLMNPNGRHFSKIKASELLLLDADDPSTMDRPDAPDPTAWDLHGAIHRNVPGATCILHVHSKFALALACLADSALPPIDQNTMRFYDRMIVDENFDGMGLGDEAERVSHAFRDNPGKTIMVMGNHGVMVTAPTVAQAFDELYYFERACETYITALSTGKPLRIASDAVARKTRDQWLNYPGGCILHFNELKRILDEEGSDYRR
ncbi:MAG: class II aldolase and adducin N-terminal domain-containing protein [Hyphomicrobiaceae bacterium]